MARNVRTPAEGTARALEIEAVAACVSRDSTPPSLLQEFRVVQRFDFSPALARAVAELAYSTIGRR